jgi:hypothetical protein
MDSLKSLSTAQASPDHEYESIEQIKANHEPEKLPGLDSVRARAIHARAEELSQESALDRAGRKAWKRLKTSRSRRRLNRFGHFRFNATTLS